MASMQIRKIVYAADVCAALGNVGPTTMLSRFNKLPKGEQARLLSKCREVAVAMRALMAEVIAVSVSDEQTKA